MAKKEDKIKKKIAKAELKMAKKGAKAEVKRLGASDVPGLDRLPKGVGIALQKKPGATDLVVSGLRADQLERLVPQLSREILIAVAADKNAFRAGMMRFVREGLFQTLIKVIAGLIVGFLLVRFGLG